MRRGAGRPMGGGSGWVLLTYSLRGGRPVSQWPADHTHGLGGPVATLALDMYEHAHHIDYGAAAAKYVDAFHQLSENGPLHSVYARGRGRS